MEIDYDELYDLCDERRFNCWFDNQQNWEEKYLKDAFSEEEITKCLNEKNIKIPTTLFNYLTKVSREFVFEEYPVLIELNELPTKENIEKAVMKENIDGCDFKDFGISYNNFYKAAIRIGNLGCGKETYIFLGEGKYFGTIWYDDPQGEMGLLFKTIDLYIKSSMKSVKYLNTI
jgi:hypothetical protein